MVKCSTSLINCVVLMLISVLSKMVDSRHIRHSNHSNSNSNHTEVLLLREELQSRMLELTSHWNCSTPKSRLVYIHEEHPERLTSNSRWVPPVAVLHRCEHHTGCCFNHPADMCKPINTEQVSILFKHVDVLKNEQTYERLVFTNHTQCGCVTEVEETSTTTTTTTLPTPVSSSTAAPRSSSTTEAEVVTPGADTT